jgi:potassium-transporting ATPase ATP-binding subunit
MSTVTAPADTGEPRAPKRATQQRSLMDPAIVGPALVDSFRKLHPRTQARNPVMFVVLVGSVLTTILFFRDLGDSSAAENVFTGLVALFLWFTVLFANFAEAMAEGRGKAQADTLRKARAETIANRRLADGTLEPVPSSRLDVGDVVVVNAGEMIPSDGEIIAGIASVDESAITGESAPVIRESGGDRSAVTGGTRVLSDQIVVQITARAGETFLDRMISLVEGAERQKTPNEIALNILLAGLTIIFLLAVVTLQPFAIYSDAEQEVVVLVALLVCLIPTTIGALLWASASPAWTAWCSTTCSPCRGVPSRRPATVPRSCSTRPALSRWATGRQPSSCHFPVSPRTGWRLPPNSPAWPMRRRRAARSSYSPSSGSTCASATSDTQPWCPSPPRPG